ncbi:2-hydroxy-6-oxononadienedioate/2-hydroxy-6-oxononatrienedioate hydrolase-like isoform X3 [Rhodamnia argentea]|uniref:2-hydroxy-6-oxononadienedioate/2-hydroxy-6- oxononatrienedioate hydrolase-like isoform X3 n=1 Tax=Rhodamnia argentea TaxID=178133 RepID=A0A8B8P1D3_9MYRT|nr:2-hydroxy-6-oxononadienedioate/2-hydroxy-6-oxononatrienedioate hydrolase-like isoform X3 [Rhodamnia argentea]
MAKCFSFAATCDRWFRFSFSRAGLKPTTTDLGDGTVMHCWVPKAYEPNKPNLLLLHGLGANAMWQWNEFISPFVARFNVYVPDLLFFGNSYTARPERTELFQAQCVAGVLEAQGVWKTNVVGISYGGFVAYSLAAQFPEMVEKLVLCCAGVCMEEKDMEDGMFPVKTVDEALSFLLPQTPEKMKEMFKVAFHKPVMWKEHLQERTGLVYALYKDRKMSDLPTITQPALIIWGEYDKVFPLELGHRLKRHLDEDGRLVVIKDCGHAINKEKPKEMYKHIEAFLIDPLLTPKKENQTSGEKVD